MLCGGSAGSLCWFSHAVSSFHEGPARRLEGLGFLPWSNAVHYADEPGRRSAFLDAVAGGMPPGYGVGDAAALHFVGTELAEVVSSRPGARARYVFATAAAARASASSRSATWGDRGPAPTRSRRISARAAQPGTGRVNAASRPGAAVCRARPLRHPGGPCPSRAATIGAGSSRWAAAGFTMQERNAALDRLVLSADRQAGAPDLLSADRQRRRRGSRRPASHERFVGWPCEPSVLSLFHLGPRPARPPRPSARPGRHLRRRRLDAQHARGLARARRRRDDAHGVGTGNRAGGAERRGDVLVRGRDHDERRRAATGRGTRAAGGQPVGPPRRRARAAAGLPAGGRRRGAAARLRGRRRCRAAHARDADQLVRRARARARA